jgi:predicted O-methyltransferase YrrM
MNQRLKYPIKYIHYLLCAKHKKGHGIHSPFMFNLITKVFNHKKQDKKLIKVFLAYDKIKRSKQTLTFEEIGAGSSYTKQNNKVGKIVRNSSINKKYGRLLYNLVKFFEPQNILELGTSVGVSTAFISQASPKATFKTIEGIQQKVEIAKKHLTTLYLKPQFIHGNFNTILADVVKEYPHLDLVFFDGNHTKEGTINYFKHCLTKINNESIFVFDDIHWSEDMESAWETIKSDKAVTVSVDLFRFGLIFFRKELSNQHYVIKF